MREYIKSNIAKESKAHVTLALIVNGGSCWGIHNDFTGDQIERLENLLEEIVNEIDAKERGGARMSRYEIEVDDTKIVEQIKNIINTIIKYELQNKYSKVNRDTIPDAVKEIVYSKKNEIIEEVIDRATKEIVRKGLPKLLERGIVE